MNTPYEVNDQVCLLGTKKWQTPLAKLFVLGMLAGAYISMGGLLSTLLASGIGAWAEGNPILPKLFAGLTFPVGLMLVVLVGGELFTGNTAYLMPATLRGDVPSNYFLKNWFIVYVANFLGAMLFDYIIVYQTEVFSHPEMLAYLQTLAEYKVSLPWWKVFCRAIGANWLVCLAVWLAFSSKGMVGRLLGLWWPVMAFVVMGFEHSIANMFYIPSAIFYGADVTWIDFVLCNLVPATLGNIVGGALLVGCTYSYIYGQSKKH